MREDDEILIPEEELQDVSRHHAKDEHGNESPRSVGEQVDWAMYRMSQGGRILIHSEEITYRTLT